MCSTAQYLSVVPPKVLRDALRVTLIFPEISMNKDAELKGYSAK